MYDERALAGNRKVRHERRFIGSQKEKKSQAGFTSCNQTDNRSLLKYVTKCYKCYILYKMYKTFQIVIIVQFFINFTRITFFKRCLAVKDDIPVPLSSSYCLYALIMTSSALFLCG